MDIDEPGWPLIDDFFAALASGRKAETCRRYARVRLRLYDFLDVDDMGLWLTPDEVTLLAAEREFVRDGALWTLYGVEGLLRCLPGFVAEPALPSTATEARMQLSVVNRLLLHLRRVRQVDRSMVGAYREAMQAIGRGRIDLERRLDGSPPVPRTEIAARFRQPPGPQW
jgi:hypothetical protein